MLADRLGVLRDLVALVAIQPRYLPQHGREPRPPEGVRLGGEVGAPEEHLALRIEKRRKGPTPLAGERLHGALIACVHVGPLIAIHLDADELLVEELRDVGRSEERRVGKECRSRWSPYH